MAPSTNDQDHPALEAVDFARQLRKQSTPAEARLWRYLRNRSLHGRKFRRQMYLAGYVVDFCCPELHLVVELDGSAHRDRFEYDRLRESKIRELGFRVVRFTNQDVLENLEGVIKMLEEQTK